VKNRKLWQVSVTVAREAEEATAALLERLFGQATAVYAADGAPVSVITVYTPQNTEQVTAKRAALQAGLKFLGTCGLEVTPARITVRKVRRDDWATSWKKYFKTIEVGASLLIRPSWSKRKPRPGQKVVTLDPGLSFGTGQHPTTAFCLEALVGTRQNGQAQAFLDIGTGSGILAIAAAKLGYAPVRAFDNDPTAVRVALANARKNRAIDQLHITRQDLTRLPATGRFCYDLICANLVHDLLIGEKTRILSRLRPGGNLVLAGILTCQFAEVRKAYEHAGLRLQRTRVEREWQSGVFEQGQVALFDHPE
jgi:ribosomal protein L11 methyltransferase